MFTSPKFLGKCPSKIIYETFEPLIVAQSEQFRRRQTKQQKGNFLKLRPVGKIKYRNVQRMTNSRLGQKCKA